MRRGRILILLGLILAIGTAAAVYILLNQAQPAVPEIPTEDVVVAFQPIAEDEPVEGRVEIQSKPVDQIPEGAVRSLEATATMLAAGPIPAGTILHPDMLISPEQKRQEGELGKLVQEGYVAVAFPIDELSSVSFGVKPGDRVDILMSFAFVDIDQESQIQTPICPEICPGLPGTEGELVDLDPAQQRSRSVAQLTLQDAQVLGVGRWGQEEITAAEEEAAQANRNAPPTQPTVPEYITLMLTPQDALVLKLAREYGASIDLAVRAKDDHQTFATEQVTLDYILARFGVSLPGKQPYTIEDMNAIRPATTEE
jgi:Flp pilus assembly protein CpaB